MSLSAIIYTDAHFPDLETTRTRTIYLSLRKDMRNLSPPHLVHASIKNGSAAVTGYGLSTVANGSGNAEQELRKEATLESLQCWAGPTGETDLQSSLESRPCPQPKLLAFCLPFAH